jgi:predicted nucleotide-binding protein
MSLADDFHAVAATLDNEIASWDSSSVPVSIARVRTAAEQVDKSWSRSWIGHFAHVFYGDFEPCPPGKHFDEEWGFLRPQINSGWAERAPEEIHDRVLALASVDEGQYSDLMETVVACVSECMAARTELGSLLSIATVRFPSDRFLLKMTEDLDSAKTRSAQSYIDRQKPGQRMSRDSQALMQGVYTSPHVGIFGQLSAADSSRNTLRALRDIARHSANHIHRLLRESGTNGLSASEAGSRVFIGHGRSQVWKEVRDFVRDRLKLPYDEFNRIPTAGIATSVRLEQMLSDAAIAVIILTAEDETAGGEKQARQNVIHEAGLFQGRLGFRKAILLLEEGCSEFSNITGLGQIRFPTGDVSSKLDELRAVLEREGIIDH